MTDKTKGVLCYLFGWLGGLIFILQKESSPTVKLHAAQSITASVAYMVLSFISGYLPIPFLSAILSILYLVIVIFGIVKSCQEGQDPEIPVIGNIAKSIFGKMING